MLGAGNVGWNAAWIAAGMEAEVVLLDKNLDRLRWVDQIHKGRIMTLASNTGAVERAVADADLVIGAVLVPGGRAPRLVTEDMVEAMRPGSVIVDVAIDQGGCVEGIRETTHTDPVYVRHGVIHYAVGNIPGAVPHTSTYALTNATLPYLVELAVHGTAEAAATRSCAGARRQHPSRLGHPSGRRRGTRRRPTGDHSRHSEYEPMTSTPQNFTLEDSEDALLDADRPFVPGTAADVLRDRMFRVVFFGAFASNIGTWMQNAVLMGYTYTLTHSAAYVGLIVFAQLGPLLLLSIVGGWVADVVDRRKLLVWVSVEQALFSVALGFVVRSSDPSLTLIFLMVLAIGIGQAMFAPAYSALSRRWSSARTWPPRSR